MSKKLTILAFLFLALSSPTTFHKAGAEETIVKLDLPTNNPGVEISAGKLNKEAEILAKYLARFDSPLQYHAQDFVDAARMYDLDWKLIPSIAGVESTFGKQIPGGYNAWGWGVYGTQAIYFSSWRDGIFTLAKGLREGYLNKGLTDPYAINRVYAASPRWGANVTFFMNDLNTFAAQYEADQNNLLSSQESPKIAAVSGTPVLR